MKPPAAAAAANPKADLFKGAIWAVGTRWLVKSIGLISTVILARFLTPQGYGAVSMAFLVVALGKAFLNTGAAHALVRLDPNPTVNQINSAWTLRGLLALVLAVVAPIICAVSAVLAFMGFANMGMTLAYRDSQFAVEHKLLVTVIGRFFLHKTDQLVAGRVGLAQHLHVRCFRFFRP